MGLFSCISKCCNRNEAKKIAPIIYGSDFRQYSAEGSRQQTLSAETRCSRGFGAFYNKRIPAFSHASMVSLSQMLD